HRGLPDRESAEPKRDATMSPRGKRAGSVSKSSATTSVARKRGARGSAGVHTLIRDRELVMVDLKFIDLPGTWQHFSIPVQEFSDNLFSDGIGFDGSSIRGFQHIHESDMLLIADPSTAVVDPACTVPTLSLVCNVFDPITRQPYTRDPR